MTTTAPENDLEIAASRFLGNMALVGPSDNILRITLNQPFKKGNSLYRNSLTSWVTIATRKYPCFVMAHDYRGHRIKMYYKHFLIVKIKRSTRATVNNNMGNCTLCLFYG